MGIKAKKFLYEGVIVLTALDSAEAWGMRNAERIKLNVLGMKCLRSLVGASRMNRVRNEVVRMRNRSKALFGQHLVSKVLE